MGKRTSGAVEIFRPSFSEKNVMVESIWHQSIVTIVVITSKCQFSCVTGLVRKNTSGGVGAFRAPFSRKNCDG